MKETGIIMSGNHPRLILEKAKLTDLRDIIALVDNEFTKEGFGFVNQAQIETEIHIFGWQDKEDIRLLLVAALLDG